MKIPMKLMVLADICCMAIEEELRMRKEMVISEPEKDSNKIENEKPTVVFGAMRKNPSKTEAQMVVPHDVQEEESIKNEKRVIISCDVHEKDSMKNVKKKKKEVSESENVETEPIKKQSKNKKKRQSREESDGGSKKKQKQSHEMPITPGWVEEASRRLGGSKPTWVFSKDLFESDTKPGLNRVIINKEYMFANLFPALEDDERQNLEKGIPVLGLDEMGMEWNLVLSLWGSMRAHVVRGEWRKLVRSNQMQEERDTVRMWRFRSADGRLCFAIDKIKKEE